MSTWLVSKYINLISPQLRNFKKKGNQTWNFSCPLCGDSQKNKFKARGYIYAKKNKFLFSCHNCGITKPFDYFLKSISVFLFDDFKVEKYVEKYGEKVPNEKTVALKSSPIIFDKNATRSLKKISVLDEDHPAKVYISKRKIPQKFFDKLFYVEKFKQWVQSINPSLIDSSIEEDYERIILPFYNETGKMFAFQGRRMNPLDKGLRYVTIKLEVDAPLIFGLDIVDDSKRVYITEGPFDSMFLNNAVAAAGSSLPKMFKKSTFIFDNEQRNFAVCRKMEAVINEGRDIFLWPETETIKDLNELAIRDNVFNFNKYIDLRTFKGLKAKHEFNKWKKC